MAKGAPFRYLEARADWRAEQLPLCLKRPIPHMTETTAAAVIQITPQRIGPTRTEWPPAQATRVPPSDCHVWWIGMPIFTLRGNKVRDLFVLRDIAAWSRSNSWGRFRAEVAPHGRERSGRIGRSPSRRRTAAVCANATWRNPARVDVKRTYRTVPLNALTGRKARL